MPCRDDGYPTQETAPAWMLCEAMIIIEKLIPLAEDANDLRDWCSQQLVDWWSVHQKKEDARVRQEAAAKLTARERSALKVDAQGNFIGTRVITKKVKR